MNLPSNVAPLAELYVSGGKYFLIMYVMPIFLNDELTIFEESVDYYLS